jgi:nitroreductase
MTKEFEQLAATIAGRRTTKTGKMNGRQIPREEIEQLLALADWAPTHGRTEPWRFFVFEGEKVKEFCRRHADLYRQHTAPEKFTEENYDKQLHQGDLASHVIVAAMKRTPGTKISLVEEIAATAAAIQNLLLAATAAGIASFWSSGGLSQHPPMKTMLGLAEEDIVMGILFLGYSDEKTEGKRNIPLSEKLTWE